MRRVWLAVALVLAVLVAVASARLFVWPATDPPGRADAVLVFAGGKGERLAEGVRQVRAGVAPVLVVSDGGRPRSRAGRACRNPPPGLQVICVTPERSSTAAEAAAFAELARREGWRSLALVTSTYHVRRASLLLDRCHEGDVSSVAARRPNGPDLVVNALHEWVGLAAALTVQRAC